MYIARVKTYSVTEIYEEEQIWTRQNNANTCQRKRIRYGRTDLIDDNGSLFNNPLWIIWGEWATAAISAGW